MKNYLATTLILLMVLTGCQSIPFGPGGDMADTKALTQHTEAELDSLLIDLDSDGDGDIEDETWYTTIGTGSGMSDLVDDTSPQLGADLDMNGFEIEGADATEIGYLAGVTSALQTQIAAKATTSGIADNTGIGLDNGSTYTNFGIAGDDTLNELFAAIDSNWATGGGGDDAFTVKIDDASNDSYLYDGGTGAIRAGTNVNISDDGDYITISASLAGGAVDTTGTITANDIPRFTDADTVEGLSYAELANVMESPLEAVMDLDDLQGTLSMTKFAATGTWSPTGTIDLSSATVTFGLVSGDIPDLSGTYEVLDADIARFDTAGNIAAVWEVQDDIALVYGTDGNWGIEFDEAGTNTLRFYTAMTGALAATDPMILFQVDTGESGVTADQDLFEIAYGTTVVFNLDEDGDLTIPGTLYAGSVDGGTTAWDGIGDPTAAASIDFNGNIQTILTSLDQASAASLVLKNDAVSLSNDTYLMKFEHAATGDEDAHFWIAADAGGTKARLDYDGSFYGLSFNAFRTAANQYTDYYEGNGEAGDNYFRITAQAMTANRTLTLPDYAAELPNNNLIGPTGYLADQGDEDVTSLDRLEFYDGALYIDGGADGVLDITADQVRINNNGPGANDGYYDGIIRTFTVDSGASNTSFGQAYHVDTDGELIEADGDVASQGSMPAIGLAVETGTGSKKVLIKGMICETDWNWTVGGAVYVSDDPTTTEGLTQTAISTTGDTVQLVGIAISVDCIEVNMGGGVWVEVP